MPDTMISNMEAPAFRNRSASIAALAAALAAAQKNFAAIPKDREVTVTTNTGGSYKFKYATLDAIMGATMPALTEQGLAISQALTEWGANYAVETTLYHSSGEWISNMTPMFLAGKRTREGRELPPGNQELGSAQTYARRYGYSALLCITADEDDDGSHADGNHSVGERIPFRPGARGTAGAGSQFRPERRQTSSWGEGGKQGAIEEAQRDGLIDTAKTKPAAGAPVGRTAQPIKTATEAGSAIKRIEWTKAAITFLKDANEHTASDWWIENKPRIDVIETALPTEYERLLDAYNEALERKVPA